MDTLSPIKGCGCYTAYLCCERHIGADVDTWTSTRRDVSEPFPCGVLGWKKPSRWVCGKWCLFLYAYRRGFLCHSEAIDQEVIRLIQPRGIKSPLGWLLTVLQNERADKASLSCALVDALSRALINNPQYLANWNFKHIANIIVNSKNKGTLSDPGRYGFLTAP